MNRNTGCAGLIVVAFVIFILSWVVTIALYVAAGAVILGGIALTVMSVRQAWEKVNRRKRVAEIEQEIKCMAQDSAYQLSDVMLQWDQTQRTLGIGTPLSVQFDNNPNFGVDIHRRLVSAKEMLEYANNTPQRIEAITRAEKLRVEIADMLR